MNTVTDREKLEHLLKGKVLAYSGLYKALDTDGMLKYCTKDKVFDESASSIIDLDAASIVLEWYEDIPEEGVLCFTWNDSTKERILQTIVQYDSKSAWEYVSESSGYVQYAVPLTPEQVLLYNQLIRAANAL